MKKLLRITLLISLLCGLLKFEALAQREYFNWYFGEGAGLTFLTSPVSALPAGVRTLYRYASSVSDSAGVLQFIAEGNTIWNRQFQMMSGGQLGGPVVFGNEVMAVPQPGHRGRYYVFVPRHWFAPSPTLQFVPPNLSYYIIDMRRQAGLGEVIGRDSTVVLPVVTTPWNTVGGYVRSDVAAVRHANGRDLWLVIKNDQQDYLSYLLDSRGLHAQPVVTFNPVGRRLYSTPTGGLLKASTDGRTLAFSSVSLLLNGRGNVSGQRMFYIEISRFDSQTGRIASSSILPDSIRYPVKPALWFGGTGGLEFSPDGNRLYVDTLLSPHIWQYNLSAGSPAAVAASHIVVARPASGFKGLSGASGNNLQLGPDGRVYHITVSARWASCFVSPNAVGTGSAFRDSVVHFSPGTRSYSGLPSAPNDLSLPPVVVSGPGSISVRPICAGETLQLASSLSPFVTAAAYAWNFGDPASGPLNTASGQAPAHEYLTSGTYTITLVMTAASGQQYTTIQTVQVWPRPAVNLGPDLAMCADEVQVLSPSPQTAGSTYLWQDGSTAAELTVRGIGIYKVTVTNLNGCAATDELMVTQTDCADLPNIITPNRDPQNEYFVLKGLRASDWDITIYNRWGKQIYQKTSYDNGWNAAGQPDGVYFYLLYNQATGQKYKGHVEVAR